MSSPSFAPRFDVLLAGSWVHLERRERESARSRARDRGEPKYHGHRSPHCGDAVGEDVAFKAAVGSPKTMLAKIVAGEDVAIADAHDASRFAQAVDAMPGDHAFNLSRMLAKLKTCLVLLEGEPAQSYVRRAICRVDEIVFARRDVDGFQTQHDQRAASVGAQRSR